MPVGSLLVLADLVVEGESFVLEPLGQLDLHAGRRHFDRRLLDPGGVADAGQHVRDRVGHHSVFVLPARLADTRDQAVTRQTAEADPAHAELTVYGPRPAAHLAAVL